MAFTLDSTVKCVVIYLALLLSGESAHLFDETPYNLGCTLSSASVHDQF